MLRRTVIASSRGLARDTKVLCRPRNPSTVSASVQHRHQPQHRLLSSGGGRSPQNAALLRATRKSTKPASDEDKINYRYRQGDSNNATGGATSTIASMWGSDDDNNDERVKVGETFNHFFDEVDAHMRASGSVSSTISSRRRGGNGLSNNSNKTKSTLETLFDSLEDEQVGEKWNLQQSSQQKPRSLLLSTETGERRSIFDAFPIPDVDATVVNSKNRSAQAYDFEAHQQYLQMMDALFEDDTKNKLTDISPIVMQWLRQDEPLVVYHLPTLNHTVQDGKVHMGISSGSDRDNLAFRDEFEQQKLTVIKAWREKLGDEEQFNDKKQHSRAESVLARIGRQCAKQAKALPLAIAWEKVKEAGVLFAQDSLNNYLHVSSTYGSARLRSSDSMAGGSGGPMESILSLLQPSSDAQDYQYGGDDVPNGIGDDNASEEEEIVEVDVAAEVAACHDNLYPPSEQSLTVRVKAMVRMGNAKAAETLLQENSDMENIRLRTYQPILSLYLKQGDMASALSLFKRMRDIPSVIFEPETYVQVIAALAENGYFHPTKAEPVDGALELGFDPPCGPGLMNQLVTALAEDVIQVTPALAKRLHTAMTKAFKNDERGRNLEALHPLAPLLPDNTKEEAGDIEEVIACRVEIDNTTGICPKTGARLRLINLVGPERQKLKDGLLDLSEKEHARFTKNWKKRDDGRPPIVPREQLEKFSTFLDKRKGSPFTAIIDGANVAYYLQNFDEGEFNFHQLQFMVDALERIKETPLVVLPQKYTRPYFQINRGHFTQKQVVKQSEFAILNKLNEQGKLYVTPAGCLDDHFWMVASISEQVNSRKGTSLDVAADDVDGRWPGTRPMLISNDLMRDHKLELIEPRLFRRWYSSYIVNYNFTGFVGKECVDDDIAFSPADFFSREIQGNALSSGSNEGDSTSSGSTIWHFPVSDWKESERFCLRVPNN